jgi:endonuclease/exonuclease/phosphatase family metal-dependent hydrolase
MADCIKLKIMSYNIWNYNEPWEDRRRMIVDTILEADPDIVGLQEIRDDRKHNPVGHDQARQIAERTGLEYQYQPAMTYSRVPRCVEGVSIMSRYPLDSTSYVQLTKNAADEKDFHQRIVLNCSVSVPLGKLQFFVTHFSLSPEMRIINTVELMEFVSSFNSNLPKFVVGDFNCTPEDRPVKILRGMETVDGSRVIGNFVDLWDETPRRAVNASERGGHTHGSRRIDYIFMIPTPWARATVRETSLIDKSTEEGVPASDHAALATTVEILAES